MEDFERLSVVYQVLNIVAGGSLTGSRYHAANDGLLREQEGESLAVTTGLDTGEVQVRALVSDRPPESIEAWEAVSEASLWCAEPSFTVESFEGTRPESLEDVELPRAGLIRVQVRARHRLAAPAIEQFEVIAWPTDEETGLRTRRDDRTGPPLFRNGYAAGLAMQEIYGQLYPLRRPPRSYRTGPADAQDERVTIRRHRAVSATDARAVLVDPVEHFGFEVDAEGWRLAVGPLDVRMRPDSSPGEGNSGATVVGFTWGWQARDSEVLVPDTLTSSVRLSATAPVGEGRGVLAIEHAGVAGRQAVLLGQVWDHLLDRALRPARGRANIDHPWERLFAEMAVEAAAKADAGRRDRERYEAEQWGGRAPSDRLRNLQDCNIYSLVHLDRDLADALAAAEPGQQREIARWAAGRGCVIAGLDRVGWITEILDAIDRGGPPSATLADFHSVVARLLTDENAPHSVVTTPGGISNFDQQVLGLGAIHALRHDDPLAAAVDAVVAAADAYGPDHLTLLADVRSTFELPGRR